MIQKIKSHLAQLANTLFGEGKEVENEHARPFYLDWITLDELFHTLAHLPIPQEEKKEILERITETIHYEILDAVLSLIPEKHHVELLDKVTAHSNPHLIFKEYELSIDIVENAVKQRGKTIIRKLLNTLRTYTPKSLH